VSTTAKAVSGVAPISIIIHVQNEEKNLPFALASVVGRFAKVFVIDAGSTDRTREIAVAAGAQVIEITGDRTTLVKQRNWALANVPFQTEWVFSLDADETIPDDLYWEIRGIAEGRGGGADGYWVRYKEIVFGRWIKRANIYPNYVLRLFRNGQAVYEDRSVNAHLLIKSGQVGYLQAHFVHDDKRGFAAYIRRLSGITVVEANSVAEIQAAPTSKQLLKANLFSRNFGERRRAVKRIFYQLPFRPFFIFCYLYFFRLGFLEGKAGFYFALYRSIHELFINMVRYERRLSLQAAPPARPSHWQ
jgi:glycosyltransferase involved in cell wall biosynthesis